MTLSGVRVATAVPEGLYFRGRGAICGVQCCESELVATLEAGACLESTRLSFANQARTIQRIHGYLECRALRDNYN